MSEREVCAMCDGEGWLDEEQAREHGLYMGDARTIMCPSCLLRGDVPAPRCVLRRPLEPADEPVRTDVQLALLAQEIKAVNARTAELWKQAEVMERAKRRPERPTGWRDFGCATAMLWGILVLGGVAAAMLVRGVLWILDHG